jgi:putative flippase GtrA
MDRWIEIWGNPMGGIVRMLTHRIIGLINLLWREVAKFGLVGGLGWIIDNALYAVLWHGPMSDSTIKARIVSTGVATLFSWFANRYWTFRHRRSERVWKEFGLFLVMNGIGLGIVLACQVVSRYVLGFQSFTADFVAGGVIGLILGTIFRFLAYRFFVFNEELDGDPEFANDHDATEAAIGVPPVDTPTADVRVR